ncbi:phage major capsid protein [Gluconacetobacter diazotrophicus]|uniref:phage major capsid protein n=1 Tax=Gluconacetobacter diazotrophicus TaxID=33996 RepID=UPI00119AF0F5|nr:phage major capsid protein [Gluconacetobacter diazotrophicus]TWA98250.1 HK97 family phage major capsid protein [Gluconacetobacter diazotrophicus]
MGEDISLNKLKQKRKSLSDRYEELSKVIMAKALDDEDASEEKDESDLTEKRIKECEDTIKRIEAKLAKDADDNSDADIDEDDEVEEEKSKSKKKSFNVVKSIGSGLNPAYSLGYKLVSNALIKQVGNYNGAKEIKKAFGASYAETIIKDLTTTSTPVVAQDYNSAAFVELRRAKSPFRRHANVMPMTEGNMTIPRQYDGAMAVWFGESQPYTNSQINIDNINLVWKKLGAFTYTTRELLMYSAINIGEKIVDDLIKQMDVYEGLAYATNATVSATQPIGLPGMVTSENVVPSKGVDFASVWATLNTAIAKIRGNNIYDKVVWFMAVETEFFLRSLLNSFGIPVFANMMDEGHIFGIPYESTALIPSNLPNTATTPTDTVAPVYLLAPDYFVIADAGSFNVEQTTQGSFITGTGTQINTFGQDLVAWKSSTRLDTALTLDNALVQILGDGWAFSNTASLIANVQTPSTSKSGASGTGQGS